jgi:hypothetical protein
MNKPGAPTRQIKSPLRKYIWMLTALAAVSALLYWEQTALLYVISSLLVTGLLLVVAFSDLEGRDRELNQPVDSEAAEKRKD